MASGVCQGWRCACRDRGWALAMQLRRSEATWKAWQNAANCVSLHKLIVFGMLEILKQTDSKWWHLACRYILRVPLTKHPSSKCEPCCSSASYSGSGLLLTDIIAASAPGPRAWARSHSFRHVGKPKSIFCACIWWELSLCFSLASL